ncbi:NTP transferase domain-containing protein [bacterium]|nr:NTP transferase domain-containing protein [bacterium]
MNLYAVVMAGGSGTRFWPLSRAGRPKQLLTLEGEKTLLERTVERVMPIVAPPRLFVVTGESIRENTSHRIPLVPLANIIAEPVQRNTAACVGLAARVIAHRDADAVLAVLPSDHLIRAEDEFRRLLLAAAGIASENNVLVTFGITPTRAETGYGYLELDDAVAVTAGGVNARRVARFLEKPDAETAEKFLASGRHAWNSGMFVFTARAILAAIEKYEPALSEGLSYIDPGQDARRVIEVIGEVYPTLPSLSIDHAVMERADNIVAIGADIGWSDVGSYAELFDLLRPDANGNRGRGTVVSIDGTGNLALSQDGAIALLGVSNLVVVHTPDVTLVCSKERAQEVKRAVEEMRRLGMDEYL